MRKSSPTIPKGSLDPDGPQPVDDSQATIKAEPDLESSINQIQRYTNAIL